MIGMRSMAGRDQRPCGHTGAIVIESGDLTALSMARSLGRRGIPVWLLTGEGWFAGFSRYVIRSLPWPAEGEARQLAYLLDLGARYRLDGWALYPNGDEGAALLARNHAVLTERFRVTVPPWEVLRWAYDKRCTYRLATEVGLDLPWTCYPRSRDEVAALDCPFPAILKPATKKQKNRFTRAKAWRVEDRQALLARYDEACRLVPPDVIMVQELIPGGGEAQFSYAALCADGRALAGVVARRTRQYPTDFGRSSTYVETIDQPEIEEPAQRLLAAMRHTGLVEVEFKRDARTGRYKLLELNARAWTWHALGGRAGVDFPYLLWRLIQGDAVPEGRGRAGVRWIRMVTDLPAAASEMRHGHLSLRAYLCSFRSPIEFAHFAADDPLPAVVDVPLMLYRRWKRGPVV